MKQKPTLKPLLIFAIAMSVGSFAYVNIHAAVTRNQECASGQKKFEKQEVLHDQDDQNSRLPIPDVTVVARVIEAVGRLLPGHN
jgi:hypothetical protein